MTATTQPIRRLIPVGAGMLRPALLLDAVVTGANGAAYVIAAGPLGDLLGLPEVVLRLTGVFLLVFAAAVWMVGSRERISAGAATAVIAANALWVIQSVAVIAFGWWSPATEGYVWVALQADVVAMLAALQFAGLRRARR